MIPKTVKKVVTTGKSSGDKKGPTTTVTRTTVVEDANVRIGRKNINKRLDSVPQNHKSWVENLMEPKQATMLPRLIPTRTSPKFNKGQIAVQTPAGQYGAVIINPSFYDTVEYYQNTEVTSGRAYSEELVTSASFSSTQHPTLSLQLDIKVLDVDQNLISLTSKYFDKAGAYTLKPNGQFVSNKVAYFPGTFDYPAVGSVEFEAFSFYNEDNSPMTYTVQIGSLNLTTGSLENIKIAESGTVNGNSEGVVTVNSNDISHTSFDNLCILFEIENPTVIGNVPRGMKFKLGSVSAGSLEYEGSGFWASVGIIDMAEGQNKDAMRMQVEHSSAISYFALGALLQNVSTVLDKGGSIVANQVPAGGYGNLPKHPEDIYNYLGSLTRKASYSGVLAEGCYGFYIPDTLEELFFIDNDEEREAIADRKRLRPSLVIAWNCPDENQSFRLWISMLTELISEDISMPYFTGPIDTASLMAYYLYLAQEGTQFCENPQHLKQLKDWTLRVVKDPRFQKLAKQVIKGGATALLSLV